MRDKFLRMSKMTVISTILILSIILSGCITETLPENITGKTGKELIKIKYLDNDPIITKEDFPDFDFLDRVYYIARENLTVSLEVEGSHGEVMVNDTKNIPAGYRIYGVSEAYNSSKNISKINNLSNNKNDSYNRYLLLQYKVFDTKEKLNDSLELTVFDYARKGFKHRLLNNSNNSDNGSINKKYKGSIFIFESNEINMTDSNVTIVLFGYDTVLGKIGIRDSKDRSFNEAIKVLDLVFDRLKINTKDVETARIDMSSYNGTRNNINKDNENKNNDINNININDSYYGHKNITK